MNRHGWSKKSEPYSHLPRTSNHQQPEQDNSSHHYSTGRRMNGFSQMPSNWQRGPMPAHQSGSDGMQEHYGCMDTLDSRGLPCGGSHGAGHMMPGCWGMDSNTRAHPMQMHQASSCMMGAGAGGTWDANCSSSAGGQRWCGGNDFSDASWQHQDGGFGQMHQGWGTEPYRQMPHTGMRSFAGKGCGRGIASENAKLVVGGINVEQVQVLLLRNHITHKHGIMTPERWVPV